MYVSLMRKLMKQMSYAGNQHHNVFIYHTCVRQRVILASNRWPSMPVLYHLLAVKFSVAHPPILWCHHPTILCCTQLHTLVYTFYTFKIVLYIKHVRGTYTNTQQQHCYLRKYRIRSMLSLTSVTYSEVCWALSVEYSSGPSLILSLVG